MTRPLAATAAHLLVNAVLAVAGAVLAVPGLAAPADVRPPVSVEQGDGVTAAGMLERLDAEGVHLIAADGGAVVLAADRVRAVRRTDAAGDAATEPRSVLVTLVDGGTLTCDDVAWDGGGTAVLPRPEGPIELPVARIRSVAWGARTDAPPSWLAAVPEGIDKDLLVVGTADQHEFVECAITAVSAAAITVLLEEETIPVKRSKVIGLQRLAGEVRPGGDAATAAGPPRAVVAVSGGSLRARRVEWSAAAFLVDGDIRLPAALFRGVDYAAGRQVSLASLSADRVEVEPWFGGLLRADGHREGMQSFFAPRTIPPPAGDATVPAIIMRPRTRAVWRLPPDSRRFRAVVAALAGAQTVDTTVVSISVDDREVFRRQVGAAAPADPAVEADRGPAGLPGGGLAIDVDVTAGRRLSMTVDFVSGRGVGGGVALTQAVIER